MDDISKLRRILRNCRTLAVVGLSANWYRPSYFAAKYMQEHGYRVIPVNPMYEEVLGERCYKSLRDIPGKIDLVDCFRKSEEIPSLAGSVHLSPKHFARIFRKRPIAYQKPPTRRQTL